MKIGSLEALRREPPASVVGTYFHWWDAHNVEGMMALLGEGVVFNTEERNFGLHREGLLPAHAWAMAAGLHVAIVALEAEGERVRVVYEYQTRADRLLGVDPGRLEMALIVRGGIIREAIWVNSRGHDGQAYLKCRREALAPFIRWVVERRPWEAEELFSDGKLNPCGQMLLDRIRRGRRVVKLLEAYRVSHGRG